MANVPDYSQYIAVKKVRAVQTANTNSAVSKGRAAYRYDGYFPLYRSVRLPANALLSNKFIVPAGPPPKVWALSVLGGSTDTNYTALYTTSDGKIVFGAVGTKASGEKKGGPIYYNTTYGDGAWTQVSNSVTDWNTLTMTRSGSIGYAGPHANYIRTASFANYNSWTQILSSPQVVWNSLECSDDGQYLYGATGEPNAGTIRVSSNFGVTWNTRVDSLTTFYKSIACSGNGQYALSAPSNGQLQLSSDIGVTWGIVGPSSRTWHQVTMSQSGQIMYASTTTNTMYKSIDYGVTWSSAITIPDTFVDIDCSDDGLFILGIGTTGLHASTDGGITWAVAGTIPTGIWYNVTCSSDGTIVYIASDQGRIYKATYT